MTHKDNRKEELPVTDSISTTSATEVHSWGEYDYWLDENRNVMRRPRGEEEGDGNQVCEHAVPDEVRTFFDLDT